jgi:formylmethanofuran dehydrogenase subunit E
MANTEIKTSIPVVSFVGNSNSGKTTFVEQIVSRLKKFGYRVATVKHAAHGFDIDRPGKDSYRFKEAGSDLVMIASPKQLAQIQRTDTDASLSEIMTLIGNKVDIIVLEGYKKGNTPKILVVGSEKEYQLISQEENMLGIVLARSYLQGKPEFAEVDIANIVNILVDRIRDTSVQTYHGDLDDAESETGCRSEQGTKLDKLLAESATVHGHICPGQVLGIRMAMRGLQELGIREPKEEAKRLVVYVEIDRCATDAIQVVTGCKLGKRTMKHVDYGKLAATFIDLHNNNAVRVVAREDARAKASRYSVPTLTKHEVQVLAYKTMMDEELFHVVPVQVSIPIEDMPGPPLQRVICDKCGEEVNDFRDVEIAGKILCRACAYGSYYERYDTLEREQAISRTIPVLTQQNAE